MSEESAPPGWLGIALERRVVRRALAMAAIVGAVLITINHGDALVRGDVTAGRLLKMVLTVLVPYMVSTVSSVAAIRQLRKPPGGVAPSPPPSPPR